MTLQEIRQEFSSLLHHYAPFAASTTFLHAHCTMHYALCTMHYMHHVRGSDFAREFSSHTDTALLWCSTTGRSVLHNTLHWSEFSPHPTPLNRGRQDDTDVAHRAAQMHRTFSFSVFPVRSILNSFQHVFFFTEVPFTALQCVPWGCI